MALTDGMTEMPTAAASRGASSVLTLARMTAPFCSVTRRSSIGPRVRQGAQLGDQKSTTTGVFSDTSSTSVSKLASVTSLTYGEAGALAGGLMGGFIQTNPQTAPRPAPPRRPAAPGR